MRSAHLLLLAFLITAAPAAAQSPGEASGRDTVYTMGEVTVTALRIEASPALVSQRVTVLDSEAIRASGSRTVADLLSKRTGLFVRRYGEGLATISARGASPSQSLILIDGLRLSDPQLGQFDVSLLPTYLLRSVEVLHGPSSALYGSDGMAGAINLRRRRPESGQLALGTDIGAFGERTAFASMSFESPRVSGIVAGELGVSDGNFPYRNEALYPAREVRRQNADRDKKSIFVAVETGEGRHRLQGAFIYAAAEQGLPGLSTTPTQGERQWDDHMRFWLENSVELERGTFYIRGFVHRGSIRYLNPVIGLDVQSRTLAGSVEGEARIGLLPGWSMAAGAVAGYASADHPSLSKEAREFHLATYFSGTGVFGPVRVYPALRGDAYVGAGGERRASVNPRLGLNIKPSDAHPLFIKVSGGRAYGAPTFNDRYWQPGGNPDLRAERSWSYEAGIFLEARPQVELTFFESRTADQIVWQPQRKGIWIPENLARTRARGIEGSARSSYLLAPGKSLNAGLIYTWTNAIDRSDSTEPSFGRQLRYVPRHQIKAYSGIRRGSWSLDVNVSYLGRRFVTSDETEAVEAALVLDARVSAVHDFGGLRARLSLEIDNVLDRRYAIIQSYPMPPRHARIALLIEARSHK